MGTRSEVHLGLRVLFTIVIFAGMIALCLVGWNHGGMGGLIGGGLGFLVRLPGRGLDWGERLGNGYVGALMGMPVGLLIGGVIALGGPALLNAVNSPPQ